MRLLLIEDEEKTSTYLSRALGESGFTVQLRQRVQVLREQGDNEAALRAEHALQQALANK